MTQSADRSVFTGNLAGRLGVHLASAAITVATLGFGFPAALVLARRWRARHTTLDGRRVEFTGSAGELFRQWWHWWLLTVATLGVYAVCVAPRVRRWTARNTRVALRAPWENDVTAAEPVRLLAAPSRFSVAFVPEAGRGQLVG